MIDLKALPAHENLRGKPLVTRPAFGRLNINLETQGSHT